MTVSTLVNRVDYTATGITSVFAYPFRIFADADLKVYKAGVLKTLTTHYTVSGAGNVGGGNVTFVGGEVLPSGAIAIIRSIAQTQAVDYVANDFFPAETHEAALDKLTMLIQAAALATLVPVSYATLPAAVSAKGMLALVTNSTVATWGSTIVGGGANTVLAFSNGTNWVVVGA
jgi:hypothetical protein